MERMFDTNFILNSCFDNKDGTLILDRYNDNYIFNAIFDQDKSSLRVKIDGMPDLLIPGKYLIVNEDGSGFSLVDGGVDNNDYINNIVADFKRIINELNKKIDSLKCEKPIKSEYIYETYIPPFRKATKKKKEVVIRGNNLILPIKQEVKVCKSFTKPREIKGYFTIAGLGGNYKIVGDKVINRDGIDLRTFLPFYINIKWGKIILSSYLDYMVDNNGEFRIEYMTIDEYGHKKIFLAGNNLWWKSIYK